VLKLCNRTGSRDSTIANELPNDIPKLLEDYPKINAIFFNGKSLLDTSRNTSKN